ncbi:MAG: hypothetical protein RBU37_23510 [Myxococcota bacterium]|jgi:hypothetical protein|nr:hypothetical protein [Myxococcota bacterium]
MSTSKATTHPLEEPKAVTVAPTPAGSAIVPAIDLLRVFSPGQWEDFALEWAHSLKGRYQRVERCGGAGDLGRDVVAFVSDEEWHNYQCKHYKEPLQPNQVLLELGKLCYSVHEKAFSAPSEYYFVAPQGAGISAEIDAALVPKVRATASELRAIQGSYGAYVRVEQQRARIVSLKKQLLDLDATPVKGEKLEFTKLTANTMSNVCSRIRHLFVQWRVADDITVAFDERTADLLVNGRKRTSHGKGVRAVFCAGYVIGLMQEALAARSGHPGFVVLDTPLNPYKEADADDDGEVAPSVKDAFYRNLCASGALGQVVVFENVAPPSDVQAACNHVHFSKSSAGRYGFLPGTTES